MTAYYNEFDPYAAQWLRNLIFEGLIARGDVDTRSIVDVKADDLKGYTQCHFFAGLGGWAYALRLAGWPDDRPVWTGSCPCQPFSVAGKQKGFDDERHLWPIWFGLIKQRRPSVVFGEQVASSKLWLDGVYADMEAEGYAVGSAVLPACAVNAPHKRDRLWFVADAGGERWNGREVATGGDDIERETAGRRESQSGPELRGEIGLWRSPNVRENGGGAYSDPVKAAARIRSGHQVNLEDQAVAMWATPTSLAPPT